MAATQVGLPSQQAVLGISVVASQRILNLTLMILAGLVTVGGALGDRLGRLRMFRLGLILVAGGAAVTTVGGLLGQYLVVLVGRAVQGVGAALFLPASTALLLDVIPPAERGKAQGRMLILSMLVTAFAPTLIGLIIQAVSWPFAYLLTVLAAGVALFLASKVKYTQRQPAQTPFDYTGGVLVFLSVARHHRLPWPVRGCPQLQAPVLSTHDPHQQLFAQTLLATGQRKVFRTKRYTSRKRSCNFSHQKL